MSKNNNSAPQTLTFIDLFSGAGGFSCGLEQAGLECLLGIDINKDAIKTFAKNHPRSKTYCGDICDLKEDLLQELISHRKVDLIVGGPPCQGFSTVGTGDPEDPRNVLFKQYCRLVKELKPEFIIMENVTGLLARKNEKTVQSIFKGFKKLGYNINIKVLCAHEYGVSEKRKRTILIGSRSLEIIKYPAPTHLEKHRTVKEAWAKLLASPQKKWPNHDIEKAQIKKKIDRDRIKRIPEGKGIRYQSDEKAYLPRSLSLGVNWDQLPERRFRQTKYQRLDMNAPSPTIMTHGHSYFHPTEPRYLTAREAAAIQSFPHHFEFLGNLSSQWRQIGNAVPPLLAKALGQTILKMADEISVLRSNSEGEKNKETKSSNKRKKEKETVEEIRKDAFFY